MAATAYFGSPAKDLTDAQWLLAFTLAGEFGNNENKNGDGDWEEIISDGNEW